MRIYNSGGFLSLVSVSFRLISSTFDHFCSDSCKNFAVWYLVYFFEPIICSLNHSTVQLLENRGFDQQNKFSGLFEQKSSFRAGLKQLGKIDWHMNQHPNNGLRRAFGIIMGKECFLQVMCVCGKNGNRIKIEMSAHLSRSTAWLSYLNISL